MIELSNDQLIKIFETELLPKNNYKKFEVLYSKYKNKEFDEEFFNGIRSLIIPKVDDMVTDTYGFFITVLEMEPSDAVAAMSRLIEKCRLNDIKDPRFHVVTDIRIKEAYKAKFKKNNFKEFYVNYLKTAIKNS